MHINILFYFYLDIVKANIHCPACQKWLPIYLQLEATLMIAYVEELQMYIDRLEEEHTKRGLSCLDQVN